MNKKMVANIRGHAIMLLNCNFQPALKEMGYVIPKVS